MGIYRYCFVLECICRLGNIFPLMAVLVAAEELAPFLDVKTTEDMVCIDMFILSTLYDDVVTLL